MGTILRVAGVVVTETTSILAAAAYTRYCDAVGGVAFNGDPLPKWEEFSRDEKKEKQVQGWLAVGGLIRDEKTKSYDEGCDDTEEND